ncbi:hypothetical protein Pfo_026126 [Paulownia fortunei]|nr:hypothetical protein Pfo_026126 [Paulownia fortunei]
MFIYAFGLERLLPYIGRPTDLLKKESRAYIWPKKEIIFKEAKPFKTLCGSKYLGCPGNSEKDSETGDMKRGMITTLHADRDLCLNQFLLGMIEVIGLEGIPGLSPALFLRMMKKITGRIAGLQVLEKMVKLVMHQAGPRVQEGTPGVRPDLVLDPSVLHAEGSFGFVATFLDCYCRFSRGSVVPHCNLDI